MKTVENTAITKDATVLRKRAAKLGDFSEIGSVERVFTADGKPYAYVYWQQRGSHSTLPCSQLVLEADAQRLHQVYVADIQKLTPALRRTLNEWLRRVNPREWYTLEQVFPARNTIDAAHRSNARRLLTAGVLVAEDQWVEGYGRGGRFRPAERYWPKEAEAMKGGDSKV